jgi:hypothetical protein
MKYTMLVKCEKCGYENFPQHRFCGMCAAELRIPGPGETQPTPPPRRIPAPAGPQAKQVPPPKQNVPTTVSGPSFLGLANEPAESRSVSYLLEDEPEPHRGRYLLLILLVGAIAAAGWHWREDLRSLAARVAAGGGGAQSNSSASPATSSAPAGSGSTPEAAPAGGANAVSQVEKPSTGVDEQAPVVQTPAPSAVPAPSSSPTDTAQSSQADQPQTEAAASQPAPASETPRVKAKAAAASATSAADDLEAEGERYLYGNGVPENCGRARTNLLAAAQRSNPKAQNVLGTMYATGHCATRDLPTAYRWFGRSLRKDPGNTRIEQDLKVLWNQMTPEERKLALRSER